MAMKKCPKCNQEFYDQAEVCPYCGTHVHNVECAICRKQIIGEPAGDICGDILDNTCTPLAICNTCSENLDIVLSQAKQDEKKKAVHGLVLNMERMTSKPALKYLEDILLQNASECYYQELEEREKNQENSPAVHKNRLTAILLSIFVGVLGIDRFYLGYTGTGLLKLLTAGGLGIWWLVDLIMICTGSLQPADGSLYEEDEAKEAKTAQPALTAKATADDGFATLERLAKLKEQGVLTEEEFSQKKAEILARM